MGMRWWSMYADGRDDAITAGQFQQAMKGAKTWLDNNSGAVAASQTVPWATLASSMPAGLSSTNNWGQSYQLSINVTGGTANAMLETIGGTAIPENRMRSIAAVIGTAGGYVTKQAPTVATGTYGGWGGASVVLASYGTNPTTVGHLVGALFYQSAAAVNGTYLWRNAVAGQPQLNQMQTAIDMNSNNINNAATVNAQKVVTPAGNSVQVGNSFVYGDTVNSAIRQSGALYIQNVAGTAAADIAQVGNVNSSGTVSAQAIVTPAGANVRIGNTMVYGDGSNSAIYQNGSLFLQHPGGAPADIAAVGNINSAGTVAGQVLMPNALAPQGGGCSPNGAIANSGNGPLFCQSGVWSAMAPSSFQNIGWYGNTGSGAIGIGWFRFCYMSGINGPNNNGAVQATGQSGAMFYWTVENHSPDSSNMLVSCLS